MSSRFQAVSCVLLNDTKILLLKRSSKVRTNKGLWSVVAGEVEADPYQTAINEIEEETGLAGNDIVYERRGKPFELTMSTNSEVTLHPFLFSTKKTSIKLNWEHNEFRWIHPSAIGELQMVPRFLEMLRSLGLKC